MDEILDLGYYVAIEVNGVPDMWKSEQYVSSDTYTVTYTQT